MGTSYDRCWSSGEQQKIYTLYWKGEKVYQDSHLSVYKMHLAVGPISEGSFVWYVACNRESP